MIILLTIFSTACSHVSPAEKIQNASLHLTQAPCKHFEKIPGDALHPLAYFTCGEWRNPYHSPSKINVKKFNKTHAVKKENESVINQYSGGK